MPQIILKTESGELCVGGACLRITPLNMKVLHCLLASYGELCSRAELFSQVWGAQVVSEDALNRAISDLRFSLSQLIPDTSFIETVPKRGYRLVQTVPFIHVSEHINESIVSPLAMPKSCDTPALPVHTNQTRTKSTGNALSKRPFWQKLLLLNVLVLTLAGFGFQAVVWLLSGNDTPRLAVYLIAVDHPDLEQHGKTFIAALRTALIQSPHIKLLSDRAKPAYPANPYASLFQEYGVHWIVEIELQHKENNAQMVVSVVEARTSLLFHEKKWLVSTTPEAIERTLPEVLHYLHGVVAQK